MKTRINLDELHAQLGNALEAEQGALRIYQAALRHAASPALQQRCQRALDEARRNEAALLSIIGELGFDAGAEGSCRRAVRNVGDALIAAMQRPGERRQEIVAECVRLADQRERANWQLFGQLLAPNQSAAPAPAAMANLRRGRSHDWLHQAAHVRVDRAARAPRTVAAVA
jgi:hypothetical protein